MYATIDDLTKRQDALSIAQLANDSGEAIHTPAAAAAALAADADIIAVVEQFLTDASLYADSYLNGCLDMTLAANQTAVQEHVCRIALYRMWQRKPRGNGELYRQAYEDAEKWLRGVQQRKLKPGVNPERPTTVGYSTTSTRTAVLTDDATENA